MNNKIYPIAWLGAISFFASSLLVSGCIRKLDVNLPQGSTQLVVNTHLTNDNIIPFDSLNPSNNQTFQPNVQLSATADPLDPQQRTITDQNALVQITENGTVVATGRYQQYYSNGGITHYELRNFKPKPNTTYSLRVKTAGFEESSATTTTPSAMQPFVAIHTIDSTTNNGGPNGGGGGPNGNRTDRMKITLKDDPNTADFYEVKTWWTYEQVNGSTGLVDTFKQQNQIFSSTQGVEFNYNSSSVLLADNTFNGQNYSFYLDYRNYNFNPNPSSGHYAQVYKITKERYLYLRSVQKQQQSGGGANPFAEPSFIFSNVSNGFGVFSFGLGKTVKALEQ